MKGAISPNRYTNTFLNTHAQFVLEQNDVCISVCIIVCSHSMCFLPVQSIIVLYSCIMYLLIMQQSSAVGMVLNAKKIVSQI